MPSNLALLNSSVMTVTCYGRMCCWLLVSGWHPGWDCYDECRKGKDWEEDILEGVRGLRVCKDAGVEIRSMTEKTIGERESLIQGSQSTSEIVC